MPNSGSAVLKSLQPLIKAGDGLTLSQVCSVTGLEPSTIQNWVKRGFVARPVAKKYRERQIARIMLINYLRDSMKLENIGALMKYVNGNADDESDDIISEEQLLDYFCSILSAVNENPDIFTGVEETVKSTLKDYVSEKENADERLYNALIVMANAYIAGEFKKKAEHCFNKTIKSQ